MPETSPSGVPVLGALETVQYGAELFVAGGLEILQGLGLAGDGGEARGQARAFPGGEGAPGEEAVGTLKDRGREAPLEQVFEGGVQGVGLFYGKAQLDGAVARQ